MAQMGEMGILAQTIAVDIYHLVVYFNTSLSNSIDCGPSISG